MYKQCIKLLLSIFFKRLEFFSDVNKPGFKHRTMLHARDKYIQVLPIDLSL